MQNLFLEQVAQLYLSNRYSDVTFIIEDEALPGHRLILATRSEYFRGLLYSGFSESNQNGIKLDVPLETFKDLLKFLYCFELPLSSYDVNRLLDILSLAHEYGVTELENVICNYLSEHLSLENVCTILDTSVILNIEKLSEIAHVYFDHNAEEMLVHESINSLTKISFESLLIRNTFHANEEQIFQAVIKWCTNNPNVDAESLLSLVRLPLISRKVLLTTVRSTNLISPNKILDAITEQDLSKSLPYRAALWPEENVAVGRYSARTIKGIDTDVLLNGEYDAYKGFTWHKVTKGSADSDCIKVELGRIHMINYIKMLLWDKYESYSYSYFIEISTDNSKWERIIDNSSQLCKSWQNLYFEARAVKYIKLVGTHNTPNDGFRVVSLEAAHTNIL